MVNSKDAAVRYQHRAEELRSIAQSMKDQKVREDLEIWAREYDRMAQYAIESVSMSFPERQPKKPD
jgi:hypothetical protein